MPIQDPDDDTKALSFSVKSSKQTRAAVLRTKSHHRKRHRQCTRHNGTPENKNGTLGGQTGTSEVTMGKQKAQMGY